VVSSSAASLPEACGPAAQFVDARSPESIAAGVNLVLSDGQLRRRLREDGFEWSRRFTWRAAGVRHAAAYRHAVARAEAGV
jgi:glycosyltransferase involved in cell wall biosynthesis